MRTFTNLIHYYLQVFVRKLENATMWAVVSQVDWYLNPVTYSYPKVFYWNVPQWILSIRGQCIWAKFVQWNVEIWMNILDCWWHISNALAWKAHRSLPKTIEHFIYCSICCTQYGPEWVWCIFNATSKLLLAPLIQAFWQTFCQQINYVAYCFEF